ncbi:phosphopantetheine-binding protein [Rhodococcus sp. 14-2483-1-2]|uniref:phosphopantetheine-binding protein n=1 Tax=Rhodococcus sp. 14-2483-1-2 TaxID=2023147 RepID=UPI000B9A677A|nr:phosphopantetheine-binding protein [Rhodococcus sp. 14-2483-1-2]OZF26147.1 acyl carrier protein [Rhodococcus sp. 14-2483-1-2]
MKLSAEQIVADVADVLHLEKDAVSYEMSLLDQGMDSVGLMELVDRWRSAGVDQVDFISLAEDSRLGHWIELLENLQDSDDVLS